MIPAIFGDLEGVLSLLLRALYVIDHQYDQGYRLTLLSILFIVFLIGFVVFGTIWLVWKDFKRKRDKTGLESLVGKEAEVIEISSNESEGWVLFQGENWKFSSVDKLKVGDVVKILSQKRMILRVKKIEADYE